MRRLLFAMIALGLGCQSAPAPPVDIVLPGATPETPAYVVVIDTLSVAPPDSLEPPPGPDPDPDPDPDPLPPPDPPPAGDFAVGGYIVPSGFWKGWRVRTHGHGQTTCTGADPGVRFCDGGSSGTMMQNTQGVRYAGDFGSFEFQVQLNSQQIGAGGGTHVAGVSSTPLVFTPRDKSYPTTRIDLNQPQQGSLRVHLYNSVGGRLHEETWRASVRNLAADLWATVALSWRTDGRALVVSVNGQQHTFTLQDGSPPLGGYAYAGNFDSRGSMDFRGIRIGR